MRRSEWEKQKIAVPFVWPVWITPPRTLPAIPETRLVALDLSFAFSFIHRLVGQPVGNLIMLAQRVADFEVLELLGQLLRLLVELAQFGILDLIDAVHLADHQLGIADDVKGSDVVLKGVAQDPEEPLVFGVVISVMAEIFAQLGDFLAVGIADEGAVAGGTRIATGSAINVGGVGGCASFTPLREQIA